MPTNYIERGTPPSGLGAGTSPAPPGHARVGYDDTLEALGFKGGDGVKHYAMGYGTLGAVTQGTSKATAVELNEAMGDITLHNATLNAATIVSFTLTNSKIGANDILAFNHVLTGALGGYTATAVPAAGSAVVYLRNNTASNLGEAIVLRFAVIKGQVA